MDDLQECLDNILHKTVLMVVLLIPLFVDAIFNRKIIKECEHCVNGKVKACADKECMEKRKNEIEGGVLLDTRSTLMCWSPKESFQPDLIVTEFTKIQQKVATSIVWDALLPFSSSKAEFGRVMGSFRSEELALKAAKELARLTKSAIMFQLNQIIEPIIEAELRHPLFGRGHTRLSVLRTRPSGKTKKTKLRELLRSCGNVTQMNFYGASEEASADSKHRFVVCDATYTYASHAFVAKFLIDGLFFRPTQTYLFAEMEETEKERDLARTLRWRLIELLDERKTFRV